MQIFNQLGELFLAAVPTVIIVLLLYLFLRWSFFSPIMRILEERHRRAEGARAEAERERATAQEKLRAYHEALRKARGDIFSEQEIARRKALDERQGKINAARSAAQTELQASKKKLEQDVEAARAELDRSAATLADEIAEAVLAGTTPGAVDTRLEEAR